MKAGTIVRLPDGRDGTVVYHGLDGYGIKWGHHDVAQVNVEIPGVGSNPPPDYDWFPDAMLRDPYPGADLPCVGEEYEIVREALP